MASTEELRTETRRLIDLVKDTSDPELKYNIASRCSELSQRAELIETATNNPEMLERYIRRCQYALAGGLSDKSHREMLERVILDLTEMLSEIRRKSSGGARVRVHQMRRAGSRAVRSAKFRSG